jgi:hypothetical protein
MNINKIITAAVVTAILSGCTSEPDIIHTKYVDYVDGCAPVLPSVGGTYAMTTSTTKSRSMSDDLLATRSLIPFESGTTMWVLVEQLNEKTGEYERQKVNSAYVVTRVNVGDNSYSELQPCTILPGDEGLVDQVTGDLLYLRPGHYRFRAVSRAFDLDPETDIMKIPNGRQVIATDDRYEHTRPIEFYVPTADELEDYAEKNPGFDINNRVLTFPIANMINQTAKLQFNISVDPDDPVANQYITQIEAMNSGCEISGLYLVDEYDWTATDTHGKLHTYLDHKDDKFAIADDNFVHPLLDDGTPDLRKLVCDACVLPTNAKSTTLYVSFNIKVNNVPTQFMVTLVDRIFEQGYNYVYNIRLTMEDGIVVGSWLNDSSNRDIDLIPENSQE